MPTELLPADLVTVAEHALTAARAAAGILAAHPDLPCERLHAEGVDAKCNVGPVLEIQVDDDTEAVAKWAAAVGVIVRQEPFLRSTQHRATAVIGGITVMVTAYEDSPEDDEPELY